MTRWSHAAASPATGSQRRSAAPAERGETLIELLVTVFILATAISAIVLGVFTMIRTSDQHRRAVRASNEAMSIAEMIDDAPYVKIETPGECTRVNPYFPPAGYSTPANMSVTVTRENLVDRTSSTPTFTASCPASDQGLQSLTVTVKSTSARSGTVSQKVTIVKREP